ncbi:hypothetical protein TNIN_165911, partial [Trichonephila inaurata madagascariensis]
MKVVLFRVVTQTVFITVTVAIIAPPSVGSVSVEVFVQLVRHLVVVPVCVPFYVILCLFCYRPKNKGFGRRGSCLHLDIVNKHLHTHTSRRSTGLRFFKFNS